MAAGKIPAFRGVRLRDFGADRAVPDGNAAAVRLQASAWRRRRNRPLDDGGSDVHGGPRRQRADRRHVRGFHRERQGRYHVRSAGRARGAHPQNRPPQAQGVYRNRNVRASAEGRNGRRNPMEALIAQGGFFVSRRQKD